MNYTELLKPENWKLLTEQEKKNVQRIIEEEAKAQAMENDEIFCRSYIYIVNKKGEQQLFTYNSIQEKIDDKIKELEAAGKPVRLIILKARQEGVSTYTQAKILCRTSKNKNRNALVVAHRDDSTNAIFEKAKYMYNNLPDDVKPLQKASNAKEIVFDMPTHYQGKKEGLNSRIKVQTAGSESIGRSDTHYYVHLSEFAFYTGESPKKQLSGILQSVPNEAGTFVIIESTANGFNDFKELWDAAVKNDNDFIPMFFAWHSYEEYQMPVTEQERKQIMSSLSEYEQKIVSIYNLTAEQVKWYRWTLKNNCNNDHSVMKQENPSFPEEAFLSTGRPVFNNEKIMTRIEYLRNLYKTKPPKKGRFYYEWNDPDTQDYIKDESIKWVDDPNGFITIYEDPKPGYPYVLSGDTKGEGKDFYAGTVINNATGNRCAVLHNQWNNSKPFTHQEYCLGIYYNMALIGVEMNFNTAPIEELERLHYPRQYTRQAYDSFKHEYKKAYGWRTDGNTRPLIIDKEIAMIEEHIELFNDITQLEEALTFVYDKNNRPDADSGKHDDVLMSDMIGNEIRSQQSCTITKQVQDMDDDEEDNRHNDNNWFN